MPHPVVPPFTLSYCLYYSLVPKQVALTLIILEVFLFFPVKNFLRTVCDLLYLHANLIRKTGW